MKLGNTYLRFRGYYEGQFWLLNNYIVLDPDGKSRIPKFGKKDSVLFMIIRPDMPSLSSCVLSVPDITASFINCFQVLWQYASFCSYVWSFLPHAYHTGPR